MDYNSVDHSGETPQPVWLKRAPLLHTWDRAEAWLVRELIGSYGIRCQVASSDPHFLFPVAVASGYQVMVETERLAEARRLLADHLRQGMQVLPGGRPPNGRTATVAGWTGGRWGRLE